jgi:surface antigen
MTPRARRAIMRDIQGGSLIMIRTLLASTLALALNPAWAVNMNVFKDAPITRLSADEVKEFRAAVMKVLDSGADGATVEWKAPKTKFVSKITPQKSFAEGKSKCREVTIESDSHDRFQRGLYTFCKGRKGEWQFRLPAKAGKK